MNVLVFNAGSASVRFRLLDTSTETIFCGGIVDRIGGACSTLSAWRNIDGQPSKTERGGSASDHDSALRLVLEYLNEGWHGVGLPLPDVLAHRIVHGGARFSSPVLLDESVIEELVALQVLAPLHNPPALALIHAGRNSFPDLPQVAVFDTAFHGTLPEVAHRYAVPEQWHSDLGVRRYGFHGISHEFVAHRGAELLDRPLEELRLISLHLGNGASATAIKGGRSIETSMGMTPLEGLVMGTRSGDMDVAAALYAGRSLGLDLDRLEWELTHESGLKGLCGATDMREIVAHEQLGSSAAALALGVYIHRLQKYIGAYIAILGGIDALIFTAGVGENSPIVRSRVCTGLEHLGIVLDESANSAAIGCDAVIHAPQARVASLVVCTDEEGAIARQASKLLNIRSQRKPSR